MGKLAAGIAADGAGADDRDAFLHASFLRTVMTTKALTRVAP
jgi:hypothetical protein